MKIIQINASYKPAYIYGGPTMSVSKLAEELVRNEFVVSGLQLPVTSIGERIEVEVLTTTANGAEELNVATGNVLNLDGVNVTYFKRLTKDHTHFSPALLKNLGQKLRNSRRKTPNAQLVVHIHAWWNLVSMLSCWVAYWYKVPVILSPRGMLTSYTLGNRNSLLKSTLHQLLGKRLLAYCHIHATSLKEKADVLANFKVKSVSVIPNFVRLGDAKKNTPTSDVFNMVFLSRIEQKKGLELLLEALATLSFPWQLDIAGTGEASYVESLKSKAESLKISKHINWLGQVSNEDKFELLSRHQLLVLTSYNENFANVVIESLSVGTPVLISDVVGLADYVSSNDFGWVCDLNPSDIAKQLQTAFDDVEKRKRIAIDAPQQIRTDFDEEILVGQYLEMYQSLL